MARFFSKDFTANQNQINVHKPLYGLQTSKEYRISMESIYNTLKESLLLFVFVVVVFSFVFVFCFSSQSKNTL